MRKIIAFAAIAALSGCAGLPIQPSAPVELPVQSSAPVGFRGAILGTAPLAGMQPLEKWTPMMGVSSREITDAYIRPGELHVLGDLAIQSVVYEYFKGRLFHIEVDLRTDKQKRCPNARELVKAIESQFGILMTRHREDLMKPSFLSQWRSSDAWITYMCDPEGLTNSILIESPRLRGEVGAQLEEMRKANDGRTTEKIKRGL